MPVKPLTRSAFVTDRALEYFSEAELMRQMGYGPALWPLVLVKELIDNGLDACEATDRVPEITVTLDSDAVTVSDNGPGLKPEIIAKALDYNVRISDKKYYVSPTRGQLGNALKCVFAAPLVACGKSWVRIESLGVRHTIIVEIDRIAGTPIIKHPTKVIPVTNGTSVRIRWPEIASSTTDDEDEEFYRGPLTATLSGLIRDFATFNPHAGFRLVLPDGEVREFPAADPSWLRWRTSDPTSPHWYTPAHLRDLIAATIRNNGRSGTVRDFLAQFDGLAGTQYRSRVLMQADLSTAYLSEMVVNGDVDEHGVARLLTAMQAKARPVNPKRLGVIGSEHLKSALVARGVSAEGFKYQKAVGIGEDRLPFVVEIAFGVRQGGDRQLIIGLNNSPTFKVPSGHLSDVLSECRVGWSDPVTLLVHMTTPRFQFTDHGKGSIE